MPPLVRQRMVVSVIRAPGFAVHQLNSLVIALMTRDHHSSIVTAIAMWYIIINGSQ